MDGCGFKTWGDIRKSAVETYLGGLSVSLRTHNGYITSIQAILHVVVSVTAGPNSSPVQYLDLVTVPDKERRRPLGFDEVCRLLKATANGRTVQYAWVASKGRSCTWLGIETGFRRNELAHLTPGSFDLAKATVSLPAEHLQGSARRTAAYHLWPWLRAWRAFSLGRVPRDRVFDSERRTDGPNDSNRCRRSRPAPQG